MNCRNTNSNEDMIVAVVVIFHSQLHILPEHQDCPVFTVFLTIETSPPKYLIRTNYRTYLISRIFGIRISRVLIFAIAVKI